MPMRCANLITATSLKMPRDSAADCLVPAAANQPLGLVEVGSRHGTPLRAATSPTLSSLRMPPGIDLGFHR